MEHKVDIFHVAQGVLKIRRREKGLCIGHVHVPALRHDRQSSYTSSACIRRELKILSALFRHWLFTCVAVCAFFVVRVIVSWRRNSVISIVVASANPCKY